MQEILQEYKEKIEKLSVKDDFNYLRDKLDKKHLILADVAQLYYWWKDEEVEIIKSGYEVNVENVLFYCDFIFAGENLRSEYRENLYKINNLPNDIYNQYAEIFGFEKRRYRLGKNKYA